MLPSGLQPIPLGIVSPPSTCSRPAIAVEAVERPASRTVIVSQRACPEPALRIARAVVHPGPRRSDLGDPARRAVRTQVHEPAAGSEQPALVAVDRCDRADGLADVVGADRNEVAVVVHAVAVDASSEDVDVQQLVAAGIPARPFAELGLAGRAGDGTAVHDRLHDALRHAAVDASSFAIGARIACESIPPETTFASNPFWSRQRVAV